MAKGRKTQYIKTLTTKDQNMLHAFRSVGYLTKEQLKNECGQCDTRIAGFRRDKYIEVSSAYNSKKNQVVEVYSLTDKGRKICEEQLNIRDFYKSNSFKHDHELSKQYFNLSLSDRRKWLTEDQIRKMAKERDKGNEIIEKLRRKTLSPADGGYVTQSGQIVFIEITTSNYSQADIEAKTEFASVMNVKLNLVRG